MAYSCKHKIVSGLVCAALFVGALCTSSHVAEASQETETDEAAVEEAAAEEVAAEEVVVDEATVEEMVRQMTLDEKISQMIIPAIRTWNEENVTDLAAAEELAEVLRRHQYGGLILFAVNIENSEQTVRLISDLQANNAAIENVSVHVPYMMPVDGEGGIVVRLSDGTRMNGSMAIGATGENAVENAAKSGKVIGEELKALGFNVDFAPDIDVNNNAANPVIGTRSFSDAPELVAMLGQAFAGGLEEAGMVPTYKHFPGHGDTGIDSHIGTPSVEKTYEQLQETELVPFRAAIDAGAEMIMTAHITFPLIDDEVVFGDGETKGYYPATMSRKIITQILREDLGFDGVVVTDALEMDAIRTAGLVPGGEDTTEYRLNVAQQVICAGVDILLLPQDLKDADAASFYDDYIAGLAAMVEDGSIPEERIDESVTRILKLKKSNGILDMEVGGEASEDAVRNAVAVVGSEAHHEVEMEIARQAVTVVRNENDTLPVQGEDEKIVILGRQKEDAWTIDYAVSGLREEGYIGENVQITVDYYYDPSAEGEAMLHYTDEIREAVSDADLVIGLSKTFSLGALAEDSAQYQGIHSAIEDCHAAGGRFILLSDNLPYDSARYQDADAIVLAYMGSGLDMDPTERGEATGNMKAYNANVVAAFETIFGKNSPKGVLPVNIPAITEDEEGNLVYDTQLLYEIGFGLLW